MKARPNEIWSKEELVRLVMANTTYSAENVGRRLRELENEGVLKATHPKGFTHYQFSSEKDELIRSVQSNYEVFDNLPTN